MLFGYTCSLVSQGACLACKVVNKPAPSFAIVRQRSLVGSVFMEICRVACWAHVILADLGAIDRSTACAFISLIKGSSLSQVHTVHG